ncbi:MAG TPA: protein kinase [Candidatus Aquilonibacter sp.]|nr:protein kinase [Candidatus Aquilonibacter sp.]
MDPEVWRRVEELCQRALALDESRRSEFLQSACGSDQELRQEVESRLAQEKKAEHFIEPTALEVAGKILTGQAPKDGEKNLAGSVVSHYRVIEKLGGGGMGVVYKAEDTDLGRLVALKFLPDDVAHDSQTLARFQREAKAASALNHPNIVTIYELGHWNDTHYIAMELISGETLRAMISSGPLPFRKGIAIATQIAEALANAHQAGLVHRDLKPENLMVADDGTAKILDFGLAKLRDHLPDSERSTQVDALTDPGTIMGTVGYMSPEQANGGDMDFRSDQFSFGAVLYEMVNGCPAFQGKSKAEIMAAILRDKPDGLPSAKLQVPAPFFWVLERCLAKDPDQRYASTRDLARDLATVRDLRVDPSILPTVSRPSNMPVQRTAFIGREQEMSDLRQLLRHEDARLVTLTGPGGIGKTRLALQVACEISDSFAGGVCFVSLSAVKGSEAMSTAIAQQIGLREVPGQPSRDSLKEYVRALVQPLLLLLDNFEHLISAGSDIAELLNLNVNLKVLVTSQALLHVYGEHEFAVPPLAVPDIRAISAGLNALSSYPAIALFVERAKAVKHDFRVTKENAPAIAAICARLDGLPLAIELAASRIKMLSPATMLTRLESSLNLLTGGARDLPLRQQTLRGTVNWSHSLLNAAEQSLFRRLSVFVGGCTLEAVEAVCNTKGDLGLDVLDGMASMVDKSLAQQIEQPRSEPRFLMLSTIREYALECLVGCGEESPIRRAHAAYYIVLAEECGGDLATHPEVLERFDLEQHNFREALEFLIKTGDGDWAMRLGAALFHFWETREQFAAGRALLEQVLRLPGAAEHRLRARVLFYAAIFASTQGDFVSAQKLQEESLKACRDLMDSRGVAVALNALGVTARDRGDLGTACSLFEQCVAAWRDLGSAIDSARALSNLANVVRLQGNRARAHALYDECLSIFHSAGDTTGVAWTLNYLGDLVGESVDSVAARSYYDRSLSAFRQLGDGWGTASVLCDLGRLNAAEDNYQDAERLYRESIRIFQDLGHRRGIARVLECFAVNAALQSKPEQALRMAGAAAALRQRIGAPLIPAEQVRLEEKLAPARNMLTNTAGLEAWSSGWEMSLEEMVNDALGAKAIVHS